MQRYLDDCNESVSLRRNSTELSEFCEALVTAFLAGGAIKAYVRDQDAPYSFQKLYKGLYNVSRKNDFRHLVKVHKQNGRIILLRCRK